MRRLAIIVVVLALAGAGALAAEAHLAPPDRVGQAALVVAGYLGFCGYTALGARRRARALSFGTGDTASLLVVFASQTGFAEDLALRSAKALNGAGLAVRVVSIGRLTPGMLKDASRILFIASTTGEGDAPDSAAGFQSRVMAHSLPLPGLHYGVLALGDRGYRHYCAFGHALDRWLRGQGASALFDPVEVDNGDLGALRHWQHHLRHLAGDAEIADWQAPDYGRWRLVSRHLLNPGSPGGPAYHLVLDPIDGAADWQAGDIAEIRPGTDPGLPHREYSIASIPVRGRLELLVRQMRHPDGRPGLGSGWLTEGAAAGDEIALRIRQNRGFHGPADGRPLILIGNGTGLAGLRAHMQARALAGHRQNWLLFGERTAAHDFFFRDEIMAWREGGVLARLDLAFSRDQAERRYVQHLLVDAGDEVRAWVGRGAAIYVCGSLDGMAAGVNQSLRDILGPGALETMIEDGRYRRDVY